jgi:hypothetical protein
MQLVTIDSSTRHAGLSKFAKSVSYLIFFYRLAMYRFESEYDTVINVEHWTSATAGGGADGNLMWCNGKTSLNIQETNWKSGQPNLADGKCVFVQFSNRTANLTTFSLGDCAQKRKFLCEVITLSFFLLRLCV